MAANSLFWKKGSNLTKISRNMYGTQKQRFLMDS